MDFYFLWEINSPLREWDYNEDRTDCVKEFFFMKFKKKMSSIVALHYVKLTYRSLLFIAALIVYVYNRIVHSDTCTYFSIRRARLGCL